MRSFQDVLLSRAWVPIIAAATLLALVPRLVAITNEAARVKYAAGVYGWEPAPEHETLPNVDRFRWTKGQAALREPVGGAVLIIPLFLARPDIATQPVTLQVTVGGVPVQTVTLEENGWHTLTYDLVAVLGQAGWTARRTITLEFVISPTVVPARVGPSTDTRELGIGLGELQWRPDRVGLLLPPSATDGRIGAPRRLDQHHPEVLDPRRNVVRMTTAPARAARNAYQINGDCQFPRAAMAEATRTGQTTNQGRARLTGRIRS